MNDVLEARVEALEDEVERLRDRIDELASGSSSASDSPLDNYDTHVVDSLEPGQSVSFQALTRLYAEAGIVQNKTAKRRVKRLTQLGVLERSGRTWTVQGGELGE